MKKQIGTLLAATVLAFASMVEAQDAPKQTVVGTVVTAGQDELTLDTATGRMTFRLDGMLDRARYNNLTPGTRVEVTHRMDDQGMQHVVTDLSVVSDAPGTADYTNRTTTQQQYAQNDSRYDSQLPQTASGAWTMALLGFGALVAGLGVYVRMRRVA